MVATLANWLPICANDKLLLTTSAYLCPKTKSRGEVVRLQGARTPPTPPTPLCAAATERAPPSPPAGTPFGWWPHRDRSSGARSPPTMRCSRPRPPPFATPRATTRDASGVWADRQRRKSCRQALAGDPRPLFGAADDGVDDAHVGDGVADRRRHGRVVEDGARE